MSTAPKMERVGEHGRQHDHVPRLRLRAEPHSAGVPAGPPYRTLTPHSRLGASARHVPKPRVPRPAHDVWADALRTQLTRTRRRWDKPAARAGNLLASRATGHGQPL